MCNNPSSGGRPLSLCDVDAYDNRSVWCSANDIRTFLRLPKSHKRIKSRAQGTEMFATDTKFKDAECHSMAMMHPAASRRKELWVSEFSDSSQVQRFLELQTVPVCEADFTNDFECSILSKSIPFEQNRMDSNDECFHQKSDVVWQGTLLKRSGAIIGTWQPRRFELRLRKLIDYKRHTKEIYPMLKYSRKNRDERLLVVKDVRREPQLDLGFQIAFSVGLLCAPIAASACLESVPASTSQQRVLLMAASDLEAVALLTCMRRILEPGRALPTLRDAMHFPAQALQMLER